MAIDWVLSLDPHWFSTIFGLLFMAGQGLTAMAFLITLTGDAFAAPAAVGRAHAAPPARPRKAAARHVMVWAYFSFSQFLIIWSGNLAEEIPWYLERLQGGWQYIGLALVLLPLRAAVRAAALARSEAQTSS